jgi:hypothetical protein
MNRSVVLASLLLASLATAQTGPSPATSATFTNFGSSCGADLNGHVSTTIHIGFAVTNAAPASFGVIVAGQQAAAPIPLPIGACDLLIDHRRLIGTLVFITDAAGAARVALQRVPPAGLDISFQAILITPDRATRTRTLSSSNGTELVTQ